MVAGLAGWESTEIKGKIIGLAFNIIWKFKAEDFHFHDWLTSCPEKNSEQDRELVVPIYKNVSEERGMFSVEWWDARDFDSKSHCWARAHFGEKKCLG